LLSLAFSHFSAAAGGFLLTNVAPKVLFGAECVVAQLLRVPLGEPLKVGVPCLFQFGGVGHALFRLPVLHFLLAAFAVGIAFLDELWIPPTL
jgi:hypothetical protein